jgi:hypothetical protein
MTRTTVDLFVEDRAHEQFLKALVGRLSAEADRPVVIRVRSAQGGHGRVLSEFALYQATIARGLFPLPDMLVAAVDANCNSPQEVQRTLQQNLGREFQGRTAFACPDPHVERWFMADPESFAMIVGAEPPLERRKCERDRYKRHLVDAIRKGGHVPTLGGIEFALDLVSGMDLYRASKNEPSLGAFVDAARGILRTITEAQGEH